MDAFVVVSTKRVVQSWKTAKKVRTMIKVLLSFAILFSVSVFSLTGCQQEEVVVEDTGIVEATEAYLKFYGVPPQGKEGRAYAAVGYLPTKDNPEKIGPLPVFLFTKENQTEKVLKKLVSGDLITSDKQPYDNPFPEDLEILAKPIQENTLVLDLVTTRQWKDEILRTGTIALMETALQFDEVKFVKVTLNGVPLSWIPDAGYQKRLDVVVDVPPPILILMAGAWEKGQDEPEEVLVEFDRPVKVNSFELYHLDGQKVEGEYFKSIFQMAVVVHPKSPELFQEGTSLRAEWNVVDELGRENSGVDTMPLKKLIH